MHCSRFRRFFLKLRLYNGVKFTPFGSFNDPFPSIRTQSEIAGLADALKKSMDEDKVVTPMDENTLEHTTGFDGTKSKESARDSFPASSTGTSTSLTWALPCRLPWSGELGLRLASTMQAKGRTQEWTWLHPIGSCVRGGALTCRRGQELPRWPSQEAR